MRFLSILAFSASVSFLSLLAMIAGLLAWRQRPLLVQVLCNPYLRALFWNKHLQFLTNPMEII